MRTSPIEMRDPEFENHSDVAFVQGNHEIPAFPSCASNQSLTKSIGLRRPVGVLNTLKPNDRSDESRSLLGIDSDLVWKKDQSWLGQGRKRKA